MCLTEPRGRVELPYPEYKTGTSPSMLSGRKLSVLGLILCFGFLAQVTFRWATPPISRHSPVSIFCRSSSQILKGFVSMTFPTKKLALIDFIPEIGKGYIHPISE